MKSLNKILKVKLNRWIAGLSVIGTLLGIMIILFTVDFYVDYNAITKNSKDALGKDFIIITKKINELHTTGLLSTDFTEKEINKIKEQPFFEEVVGFNKNLYQAYIESKSDGFPLKFSSLVTFEAIPDKFLDVNTKENWEWTPSSSFLPVIVPRSYINMYNFGMADMQGLPVISEKMISNFTVELNVSGNGQSGSFDTKIVGFSDRIESVIVPQSFIDYSNKKYSSTENHNPTKLIATTEDVSNPAIVKFLEDKGYFTNQEKLKGSKSSQVLNLTVSVVIFLGLLVMLLSLIGFIQQTQIKISKSKEVIYKLFLIGTPFKELRNYFVKKLIIQFGILGISSMALVSIIRFAFISPLVTEFSLDYVVTLNPMTLSVFLSLILVSSLYIFTTINQSIKRIIT